MKCVNKRKIVDQFARDLVSGCSINNVEKKNYAAKLKVPTHIKLSKVNKKCRGSSSGI